MRDIETWASEAIRLYRERYREVPPDIDTARLVRLFLTGYTALEACESIRLWTVSDRLAAAAKPPDSKPVEVEPADDEPVVAVVSSPYFPASFKTATTEGGLTAVADALRDAGLRDFRVHAERGEYDD